MKTEGDFSDAGGSHALEDLVDEVAKNITDPQTGVNLFERLKARDVSTAASPTAGKRKRWTKQKFTGSPGYRF